MRHPLLAKAKAFQPADDNRPFEEFMMEQVALAEEVGGETTLEEIFRKADEDENFITCSPSLKTGQFIEK
ncbi:hypothetical protein [Lautropia mirabilis]|jgi:hypothetical protein|uniref:hypothetical protein n=1 Tax=Lautropia mirabilis TaxID=47671 RepID=UPI0028899624|nr:hypothetical protein [Lautropia mirabilis]